MTPEGAPIRLQRKRAKGYRLPPGAIYVGRPSRWGNPFRVGDDVPGLAGEPMDATDVVHCFQLFQVQKLDLAPLRGHDLACWCALDRPCHADVLLAFANAGEMQMAHKYRIIQRDGGYEPQMLYVVGVTGKNVWFPMNSQGYWLEPNAYSYGIITRHSPLPTREEAERAIERAKLINADKPVVGRADPR